MNIIDSRYLVAKISDENRRIKAYSNQVFELVKKQYLSRKIDIYDYERFVNLITCMNLTLDDTDREIDDYIKRESNERIRINLLV